MLYRLIVTVFWSAIAVAGFSIVDPAPGQRQEPRKCIGVISTVGKDFAVQKLGLTAFGNEFAELGIDAWHIDDLVVDSMGRLLKKRFETRRINVPNDALASLEGEKRKLFGEYEEKLRNLVRDLGRSVGCDYYVVITKGSSRLGNTNQTVAGLGIVDSSSPFISNVYLHALASLRAYDGRTFELLRHRDISIGQRTFLAFIVGPHREVDKSYWPRSGQGLQDPRLKDGVWQLLDQGLTATVPQLFAVE